MSVPTGAIIAATAGASAAAAAAARMKKEEEEMTGYQNSDLEGWEFKILRANTAKFKNHRFIQEVCQQEAKAGWEMVEKFDNYRIRFKRRTDQRKNDQFLDSDPYRTYVGISSGALGATITGAVLLGVMILLAVVFMIKSGADFPQFMILIVAGLILVIGVVVAIVKNRNG